MSSIYAEITLINGEDIALSRRNIICQDEIKKMKVDALISTRTLNLCINESIQNRVQFPVVEKRKVITKDGRIIECDVVDFVEVKFKNRATTCRAIVLPGDNKPLLGSIPFDDMDVLIHPLRQELIINPDHPYFAQMKLK